MKDKYNKILKSAKDLLSKMDTDEFLDKFLRIQDGNKEKDVFVIDIAKDFSQLPHGRYHSDSPDCAEALFILVQDVLEYEYEVELRFNDMKIAGVGSCFLEHLAALVVINHCSKRVTITSDNDWVLSRYNKYFNIHYDKWRLGTK